VLTIGVDLGGTKLLGVVADGAGTVVAETLHPSGDGPEAVLAGLAATTEELSAAVPDVQAVGVGVAGMVDFEGVVRYAPNIPGIEGLELGSRLEKACRLPVAVDNDANVAALGEVLHGAARGFHEVLVLTFGTGIGGGIVTGGGSCGAGTAWPPRSATSPSIPTGRPAPAAPGATGSRSPRGRHWAGWAGSGWPGAMPPRCWPGPAATRRR
jgi:Transcriptional regulator/sugar kinase